MDSTDPSHDVFFSYNWPDHDTVEPVARALGEAGLHVFLDRWYLVPGRPWPEALESALAGCGAVAIFVGPQGLGRWQQRERDLALDRQAHEPDFRVIPVLLPGADPALGFLSLNTWVELGTGRDEAVALLAAAVRGEPPGPELGDRIRRTRAAVCPYRGLRPFREEDAAFFFGREAFTEQLDAAVHRHSLVALIGGSGSGKSSVARAGLVPRLRATGGACVWDVVTLVPGDRPLYALAASLMPLLEPEMSETGRLAEIGKLAGQLGAGAVRLRDVVARALEKQPGTDRLLLVADQWEELYTLTRDDEARSRFVAELLAATAAGPLSVVLTMRGDFFGHAIGDRALADRLQGAVVALPPMARDELERAIEGPAERAGLSFEPGLVGRILEDVEAEPGSLPLLEFVLAQLWERRRGVELHHEAYESIGEVRGAIAGRAEGIYEGLPDAASRERMRAVFGLLVRAGEGTQDTRRRATMSELGEAARPLVTELADARLLVTGRDRASNEETIEVAHEALIRGWARLREWLDEDREQILWRQRLRGAIREWLRTNEDAGALLRGQPLEEAERWVARGAELGTDELRFTRASAALVAAERAAREREQAARERKRRRNLRTLAGVAALAVGLAVAAALGWQQARTQTELAVAASDAAKTASEETEAARALAETRRAAAEASARLAEQQRDEADRQRRIAQARRLESDAEAVLAGPGDRRMLSLLLAAASLRAADTVEGWIAWSRVVEMLPRRPVVELLDGGKVRSVAYSPDGALLASGDEDGRVRLRDWPPGATTVAVDLDHPVLSLGFSPRGRYLFAAGRGDVTVIDVESREPTGPLPAWVARSHPHNIRFSPDGQALAVGHAEVVVLHDTTTWRPRSSDRDGYLTLADGYALALAFSPTGDVLAIGGKHLLIADGETGAEIAVCRNIGPVHALAIDPRGGRMATAHDDGSIRQFDGKPTELAAKGCQWLEGAAGSAGHTDIVSRLEYSSDGARLVSASGDGTVRIWGTESGAERLRLGRPEAVTDLDVSPDGLWVAAASGTTTVWELAEPGATYERLEAPGGVRALAFSPDGRWLVGAARAGGLSVIDTQDWTERASIALDDWVEAVAFSRDGALLVTRGDARTRVLEVGTWRGPAALPAALDDAALSPDGRWLAGVASEAFLVFEYGSWNPRASHRLAEAIDAVLVSPDQRWVLVHSATELVVIRAEDWSEVARETFSDPITHLRFHEHGDLWIETGREATRQVPTARSTLHLLGPGTDGSPRLSLREQGTLRSAAPSPDGAWIVTYWEGSKTLIWETATGRVVAQWSRPSAGQGGESGRLDLLAQSKAWTGAPSNPESLLETWQTEGRDDGRPEGAWAISDGGSLTRAGRAAGTQVVRPRGAVARFDPRSRWLATSSDPGRVAIWPLAVEDQIVEACTRLTRDLTPEEAQEYLGAPGEGGICDHRGARIARARDLGRWGDVRAATEAFLAAGAQDGSPAHEPEALARRYAAQGRLAHGRRLAAGGADALALGVLGEALDLDPTLDIDPEREVARLRAARHAALLEPQTYLDERALGEALDALRQGRPARRRRRRFRQSLERAVLGGEPRRPCCSGPIRLRARGGRQPIRRASRQPRRRAGPHRGPARGARRLPPLRGGARSSRRPARGGPSPGVDRGAGGRAQPHRCRDAARAPGRVAARRRLATDGARCSPATRWRSRCPHECAPTRRVRPRLQRPAPTPPGSE